MRTGVEKNRSHPKGGDVTDTIQQVLYTAVGLVRNGLRYIIFYFYFPSLTKTLIFKLKNGIFLAGSKKSKAKQLYFWIVNFINWHQWHDCLLMDFMIIILCIFSIVSEFSLCLPLGVYWKLSNCVLYEVLSAYS